MIYPPAQPENPAALVETKVYEAVCNYVRKYTLPALDPANVIQGWGNRQTLPEGTEEYAVVSVLYANQVGTTVEHFAAPDPDPSVDGRLSAIAEYDVSVQVDFCSSSDIARVRAQRLAMLTRSSIGSLFFGDYGMGSLYAEGPRDLSYIGGASQFIRRWSVTLHVDVVDGVTADYPFFDKVSLNRVENVDVHHPPVKD